MAGSSKLLVALVLLLLLEMLPSAVHAGQRASAIRLDYSAPADCPSHLEFFELIRLRSSAVTLEDEGEARRFTVSLEKNDSDGLLYRGRLGEPGSSDELTRKLEGASCEEVARGLALIIAMQIAAEPRETAPVAVAPPEAPVKARPRPLVPPSASEGRRFELAVLAGASVGLTSGIGARAAPMVQAGLEVRSMSGPWFARPSVRLAASVARAPEMHDRDGTIDATAYSALLRACPLTAPGLGARLSIEPCAWLELGRLVSLGRTPKAELGTASPWTTLGGGVHMLGWTSRTVFLEADLVLFAPLDRYRSFLTTPESPLFETPQLGFRWSVGGGVRFP